MGARGGTGVTNINGEGVLITGCSSGIGRATAIYLAQQGYTVFATVRKETDADDLRDRNEPNLIPVCPLDLTRREDIPGVVETVADELQRRGKTGLYALVNNAGGGSIAPIELMDLDKFAIELEARLVGAVGLVQAFLPMIRQASGGRILWIVTPAIIPTPYVASIHAADFAVNCIARTLQLELKPCKIPSVMIRCGGIQTPAAKRTLDELEEARQRWPQGRAKLYDQALQRWQAELTAFDAKRTPPEEVARVVLKALSARLPRLRYSVGHMAHAAAFLESLPQALGDAILARRF